MRAWKRVVAGVAGLVAVAAGPGTGVLAGPGTAAARQSGVAWTHDGYAAVNTNYNPDERRINRSTVGSLRQRWAVAITPGDDYCSLLSRPVVAAGRLFTTTPAGVAGYDATTGARRWLWPFPAGAAENAVGMVVVGGLLVVLSRPCEFDDEFTYLTALDVRTGAGRWRVRRDQAHSTLAVDRGVAAIGDVSGDSDDAVTAYRVADGRQLWRLRGYRLHGEVSARGRLLLTRADRRAARAVAIATGRKLWERPYGWQAAAANPAGDQFVVDTNGGLGAVDAGSGRLRWSTRHGGGFAHDGRRIYLAYARSVETYDAATGRKLRTNHQPDHAGSPVRAGGLLYVALGGGNPMAIIDPPTGRTIATFPGSRYITARPVVVNGWLYIVDGETLRAYAP